MLILQAAIDAGSLSVWGECPPDPDRAAPRSPFDPDADRLRDALANVLPKAVLPRADRVATSWLPTIDGRPVASSPLIEPRPGGPAALAPWQVTALWLPPSVVVELLGQIAGRETLAPGVAVGSSLAFWATALRFAGSLVSRDAYLPGLSETGGVWRALWRPLIAGRDAARFARLTAAMPPAARALGSPGEAPARSPADVLTAILTDLVDRLVRSAAGPVATSGESLHDRWVAGLTGPEAPLPGPPAEWRDLAATLADWARPLTEAAAAPFRLCFRLQAPALPTPWHLR